MANMRHGVRRVASHCASVSATAPLAPPPQTAQLLAASNSRLGGPCDAPGALYATSAVERVGPTRGEYTWLAAPRHIAPRQRRRRRFPRRRRPFRPIGHCGTRRTHCTHAYPGSRTGLPYPPPKLSECGRRGETLWRCANRAKLSGYAADGQNSGVLLKHQFDHHTGRLSA